MCNVGQHISKTSMATPQLFYIDEIQVLQRILLQFFKQIVYFYILGVSHLKVARPLCHVVKRYNASVMNDIASPFWDEN